MKKSFIMLSAIAITAFAVSCSGGSQNATDSGGSGASSSPVAGNADNGKTLFDGKGCAACHNPENKVVGPSLKEIAAAYDGKSGQMVDFLKEKADPIVDPSQYAVMQASLSITKSMSDQELNDIVAYIGSHK